MSGQVNLKDAVNGTISFHDKARNRAYKLNEQTAKLFVRPRGWHLPEAHILIDGEPATGCLVDFGLYFTTIMLHSEATKVKDSDLSSICLKWSTRGKKVKCFPKCAFPWTFFSLVIIMSPPVMVLLRQTPK